MNNRQSKTGRFSFRQIIFAVCLSCSLPRMALAENPLLDLSIEKLLDINIVSISKRETPLSSSPAAAFVLTSEDIRRSGAALVPEALRLVPGLQVARINAHEWAISIRGFNGAFSDKLLVLVDGRTVYTPVYSGVFWDTMDFVLDDIKQIEVIRGPAASLWGVNAVNGVINIITKNAKDTQGGLISAGAGNVERALGAVRWGGKFGDESFFRVYAKETNVDDFPRLRDGGSNQDGYNNISGGFRVDSQLSDHDSLKFKGDVHYLDSRSAISEGSPVFNANVAPSVGDLSDTGFNLLARWTRDLDNGDLISFQSFFDRVKREDTRATVRFSRIDAEFEHNLTISPKYRLVYGLGWRLVDDELSPGTADDAASSFSVSKRQTTLLNGFVQSEIPLMGPSLVLTLGNRFSHNDFTGFEIQPTARLLWQLANDRTLWLAGSRALRKPSRADEDLNVPVGAGGTAMGLPVNLFLVGNSELESEELWAFEAGYREQLDESFHFDMSGFVFFYDKLRTQIPDGSPQLSASGDALEQGLVFQNALNAVSFGLELAANYQATPFWNLRLGYSFLQVNDYADDGAEVFDVAPVDKTSPQNQITLRSNFDVRDDAEFDVIAYYVDRVENGDIDGYFRLDLRTAYTGIDNLELSLALRNVLNDETQEWDNFLLQPVAAENERSLLGMFKFTY